MLTQTRPSEISKCTVYQIWYLVVLIQQDFYLTHSPNLLDCTTVSITLIGGGIIIKTPILHSIALLAGIIIVSQSTNSAGQVRRDANETESACEPSTLGSPYVSVDSWVYPAVLRLYSMGFIDSAYLGMRPWTRASLSSMLEDSAAQVEDANSYGVSTAGEAQEILSALNRFLRYDAEMQCQTGHANSNLESMYSVVRGVSGIALRDSFHLGSTIINDFGRPFEGGLNNYSGASGYLTAGRFVFYLRGEFEGAPSAIGYSAALSETLTGIDQTTFKNPATGLIYNQATIPMGPIDTMTNGRVMEAYVSARLLNHELSFGKQDEWLGPGLGGGMAYSSNAENVYSFRINRVEPLHIPLLSNITGPFRYDFMVGPLRGHTYMPSLTPGAPNTANVVNPGDPWVHVEKISLRPTKNLEFGFERTVIWGGKGHEGINIHSFLRSFISLSAGNSTAKRGNTDPGARFGAFDFSYRLPYLRNWLTLYTASEVHDDVSPIDAPRRASWRPGIYLSHVPAIPKLDIRVEGVNTDPPVTTSQGGEFMYWEMIQRQGYTNQGQMLGDWIGREAKGGQGWITFHLRGNEWIQFGVRNQKVAKDFIPGGTTLNDINFQVVKRIGRDFEINGNFTCERWKAPIYLPGLQTVTSTTMQLTWFPQGRI